MEKTNVKKSGFTIVELLTVMAVIAVLIGLLIPALGLVKDNAKKIQQKAQFHGIEVGLELYKTEFGSYAPSNDNQFVTGGAADFDTSPYGGANKLAEAMVGLDLLGFHPNSNFRSDGKNTIIDDLGITVTGADVYDTVGSLANWQTGEENLNARKGPFIDLEHANAFRLDEVYTDIPTPFVANFNPPGSTAAMYPLVLCDVYAKKRGGTGAKKTGNPILYYRARTNYQYQDSALDSNGSGASDDDDIYNYYDNEELLLLGMPDDGADHSVINAVATGDPLLEFERMIVNDQVQTVRRPYRADSFILISAGKDGDFGTADDVFNFDKEIIE